ncbi:hypothetical protein SUGI_0529890 [Cryptomeria japonica]|nr:hypothetical protein SUGI_0529890 [Cryptomeria japonica]
MKMLWLLSVVCLLQICLAQDLQTEYLNSHNDARSKVGVNPLVWDDTVAAYAQKYANERNADCALEHSSGSLYGENIYVSSGEATPADAVKLWVDEEQYYDYDSNSCAQGQQCGHYTQVVWSNTQRVGCASVTCDNGGTFIICSYDPPGNFNGQRAY